MLRQNHGFLQRIALHGNKLTKISDNSNNVHLSAVRFICSPYLASKLSSCFAQTDNDKMQATNESYALDMNITAIL